MDGGERESDKGFKFQDRRRIFKEGEDRPEEPPPVEPEASAGPKPTDEQVQVPTFAGLLFSFASNGLTGLGLVEDPLTGKKEVDLVRAEQSIAILELLQEKTKGNLTEDEAKIIEGLLYELRMKYIEVKEEKK